MLLQKLGNTFLYTHILDKRGSSIYKNRPKFSMFGIGDYSFSFLEGCYFWIL